MYRSIPTEVRASNRLTGKGASMSGPAQTRPSRTNTRLARPSVLSVNPHSSPRAFASVQRPVIQWRHTPARLVPGTYSRDLPSSATGRSTSGSCPSPPTCSGEHTLSQPRTRSRWRKGRPAITAPPGSGGARSGRSGPTSAPPPATAPSAGSRRSSRRAALHGSDLRPSGPRGRPSPGPPTPGPVW